MENRILMMIGNGFDLAHGLQTSYMAFYNYLKVLQTSTHTKFTEGIKFYFTPEVTVQLLTHPVSQAIITILHLDDMYCENVWHSYFMNIVENRYKIGSWIDFEKEIEHLIKNMILPLNSDEAPDTDYITRFKRLMHCHVFFSNYPDKSTLDKMATIIQTDSDPNIREKLCQKVAYFLYEELLRYTFCFELYLSSILPIVSPLSNKSNKPLAKLFEVINQYNTSFLLSFNYTSTAHDVYDYNLLSHHIHGQLRSQAYLQKHMLESKCQLSTPLVMGFHASTSDTGVEVTPFLFFEKFYQRILHHTHTDIYRWLDSTNSNSTLDTVIYGHSLDSTDEDFIRLIFEKSTNIIIYYHSDTAFPALLQNLISIFGRDKIDRDHANGKVQFFHSNTLMSTKQEYNYVPT